MHARRFGISTLALAVFAPILAVAQSVPALQAPLGLDVSLPAAKRLAGSREFIAAGEWDAAIKSLDLLVQEFGDSLIEVEPGRFLNVRHAVASTLAQLPRPGLAAYRRRVDPTMKSLLSEAAARRSQPLMWQLVRDGFASSYGDNALDWIAENSLAIGDVEEARRAWSSLMPSPPAMDAALMLRHPDADLSPADVAARLVLCSLLQGDRLRAYHEIAAFESRYGAAVGSLAGQTGPLAQILAGLLADSRDWSDKRESGHGHPDLSAVLWTQPLTTHIQPEVADTGEASVAATTVPHVFPAVWNDVLILPGTHGVRALNLANGAPRWPSGATIDDGTIFANPLPSGIPPATSASDRASCQIVDGRCYARIGATTTIAASSSEPLPSELVCLDLRAEGRLAWSVGSHEFAEFRDGLFSGPPLIGGDRVYIPVRRTTPQVEVGLACFGTTDGQLHWYRRVGTTVDQLSTNLRQSEQDVLATGAGLVFLLPATGLLAAADAESGALLWVVAYPTPSPRVEPVRPPVESSGLLFHGGRVFVTPRDSNRLMAFHAADGRLLWSCAAPGRIRDLLGVVNGRLIASGDQLWGFDVATGDAWRFGFSDPEGYGDGRGAMAGGRIYWPTRDDLFVVDSATGQILDRVLFNPAADISGGNLAIAGDRLIIASPARITILGPAP